MRTGAAAGLACGLLLLACAAGVRDARADTIRFLVAEIAPFHGDSYVLPLSDPADVAHARALVAQGPAAGATIVFARIAAGADGKNRDFLAPGAPAWSWHVTDFLGFGDLGIELLDGWPTFVESDVAGWIANTNGEIGFWSYTVVQELGPIPEPVGALLLGSGLILLAAARAGAGSARARSRRA